MKQKWVIGNWKMNLGMVASVKLAKILSEKYREPSFFSRVLRREHGINVVVCPSFTSLYQTAKFLQNNPIAIGAQDVFWEEKGAFTGEISPLMLLELGCDYVLLGHSERRTHLGEDDGDVHRKLRACIASELTPVICVGETQEDRRNGNKETVIVSQIEKAFAGMPLQNARVLIAYEPVRAIGTGNPVQPDEVCETIRLIKHTLAEWYDADVLRDHIYFLYGGSVDAENAASFTSREEISGVLAGGASLGSKSFLSLIEAVAQS